MKKKPIIRHCKNCQWCEYKSIIRDFECAVKYEPIYDYGRRKALFCRHYTQKEEK